MRMLQMDMSTANLQLQQYSIGDTIGIAGGVVDEHPQQALTSRHQPAATNQPTNQEQSIRVVCYTFNPGI